ncbi:MAG: DUF2752 domain-containing protein [Planctomycetales bacterium]|nr:DUF2752 domain-containing protein [Planctomycetales bacterium]
MKLRIAGALTALLLIALLVTASALKPSSAGLGTHHQLGLPPCTIRVLFGVRCPSCGMTTSWAHVMRGNLLASAKANPGGMLLAFYAMGCIGTTSRMAWDGRFPSHRVVRNYTIILGGIALVTVVDWILRLTT